MLPKHLVLVRHGQSEFNEIVHNLRNGVVAFNSLDPKVFQRTGSKWRLTDLGRSQATAAGEYIKKEIGCTFDGYFVSDFIRAKETAARLDLPEAQWKVEPHLRERDWGNTGLKDFVERGGSSTFRENDAFYGSPPSGESIASMVLRVDRMLDTLHREYADKKVIIVCHGELMWGFRVRLERMLEDDFIELDKSRHPHERIHNCQIIEYIRNEDEPYFMRTKQTCPWDTSLSSNTWKNIVRRRFTNKQLLSDVFKYPTLLEN